jgi:hypothetical protein
MAGFTKMISMEKTPEQVNREMGDGPGAMTAKLADMPRYPYGLCLNLESEQLDKLGIDGDCDVGDLIHLCAMAEVTDISKRKMENGDERLRIELQITHLATLENEDREDDASMKAKKRYSDDEAA